MHWCICIILCLTYSQIINGEVYSAISHMEQLIDVQRIVVENLKQFVAEQREVLFEYEKRLKKYEETYELAKNDVGYFGNPINGFLITKGLTNDWNSMIELMKRSNTFFDRMNDVRDWIVFPTEEDLQGAAVALTRLQYTYRMNTSDVSHGILNGKQYNSPLNAAECYEIGRQLFYNGDLEYAMSWLEEADQKMVTANERQVDGITRIDIIRYMSYTTYHMKNIMSSIKLINQAIEIAPDMEELALIKIAYEDELRDETIPFDQIEMETKPDDTETTLSVASKDDDILVLKPKYYTPAEKKRYEQLCRKEIVATPAQQAPLRCRYVTNRSAFLRIAPLKMEEVSLDPLIVTYHDALYESEINTIQQLSLPRFERAGIRYHKEINHTISDTRVGKTAWLDADDSRLIRNIELRVEDMTGLSIETSEKLQVVNYGIGGQYEPHFDFALRDDNITFAELNTGNRIATALFYMTDVEQGGATVFPYINVALWPQKGSAALWYNLYKSGEGDFRTKHGSCPVLVGSKWICNKWLHESKQEFLRPCQTEVDHPPLEIYD